MDFSEIKGYKFTEYKVFERPGFVAKQYYANGPLEIDAIIRIIASCESEDAVLYECQCETFNEEGRSWHPTFRSVDRLEKMHDLPNPSIKVQATFVDPCTGECKFHINTAVNNRIVEFSVSDKASRYVKKMMELDAMEREAAERRRREGK